MAFFEGSVNSESLGFCTGVTVVLPHDNFDMQGKSCRVVYLLHGLTDGHNAWERYTRAEKYAEKYGVALIMPEVQRGFYLDCVHGPNYFTYVTEELPQLMSRMFHISAKREDTFVAGLSMGGYGALKCALTKPQNYAACAAFSSACDLKTAAQRIQGDQFARELVTLFGAEKTVDTKDDVFEVAKQTAKLPPEQLPRIFMTCGTEDFLYEDNLRFRSLMESLPYDYRFEQWQGSHNWDFWDQSLIRAMEFFFGTEPK